MLSYSTVYALGVDGWSSKSAVLVLTFVVSSFALVYEALPVPYRTVP